MRFEIVHTSTYRFSEPAFLEPHVFRLRPRDDSWQHLRSHSLDVVPSPAGLSHGTDAAGNQAAWAWFDGEHERLDVTVETVVETLRTDPFDYVVPLASLDHLPVPYQESERSALQPYTAAQGAHDVVAFAHDVAAQARREPRRFLFELTTAIYDTCEAVIRLTGDPLPPERTLGDRSGSCRDLAVLYVECCRVMGVAARFVSGYQEGDPDTEERHLHAWAEAYVPGGGWRGFDPTHGLAVSDRHVALAAAPSARGAAAVTGTFRKTGASSEMSASLDITVT